MNRTITFLALAGLLALVALLVGRPGGAGPTVANVDPPHPGEVSTPVAGNGSLKLTARLSHPWVLPGASETFVTVDVEGVELPGQPRSPVNLALVIDRSGSMNGPKLANAKEAARHLVKQLGRGDRLSIVHYGSDVAALSSMPADPDGQARMLAYVDGIWDEGGTNISAGLEEARRQLLPFAREFRVSRVILLSDGQPTEGLVHDEALTALARQLRADGLSMSAIGVGEAFNEDLMQAFAEYGAGAYGYLREGAQLATLFERDLKQAATTVAQQVALELTLPPGVELDEVLGYRSEQQGRRVQVALPDLAAGQTERVVARLRLQSAVEGTTLEISSLRLHYTDVLAQRPAQALSRLTASVSGSESEVLARRDKSAIVQAARALAARNTQEAAQALQEGRADEARRTLMRNVVVLEEAQAVAGAAPLEKDFREQAALMETSRAAAASPAAKADAVKSLKLEAQKGFGRVGSRY
jgi:Ca-activated chloride channel family protein